MNFRSPPPHRSSSGNLKSRRVWVPDNKIAKPHQGTREIARRRRRANEVMFNRLLADIADWAYLSLLEQSWEKSYQLEEAATFEREMMEDLEATRDPQPGGCEPA